MQLGNHPSLPFGRIRHRAAWIPALALVALLGAAAGNVADAGASATLPSGFSQTTVYKGLQSPTALRFSPDGRVFVAEKSGLIKVFDGLGDKTPTTFADLRTEVHNYWDRGLLGMALDPNFPAKPYVYVLYTYDAAIGGQAPRWGSPGASGDSCPTPPGPTTDGCVVSGRLSRLTASGDVMTGAERVLINDWCQQYPSHSVGDLQFGGGKSPPLYVSGGDGASFTDTDYGQLAGNPCGDPPGGEGTAGSPPTSEGGALRSQSARRPDGEPRTLDGTILKVNPATGQGLPGNPYAGSSDANARRILAYGLRNPFRFTVRYGTGQIWIGDVGWNSVEEINEIVNPSASSALNFGWPCYEGVFPQPSYRSAGLDSCDSLYSQSGAVTPPFFSYRHSNKVVPGESCPTGSSSTTGLAFYPSTGPYPPAYRGALFFADYSRK
ncbi:MAG: PQQ-dependent sugar dehydrogenase, partial [Solirubrobacterales bacterium]